MNWKEIFKSESEKEYYSTLMDYVNSEYEQNEVFPEKNHIFRAFEMTPYDQVKVVILGQDPYHDIGQAHGLSFSVNKGVKIPPSLANIYRELESDLGVISPNHGDLINWSKEGVLLLNTVLTVRAHEAHSHKNKGWEIFTDEMIRKVNEKQEPVVFILWGNPAQKKRKMIDESKHLVITSPHPSPLSSYRGFFGSKPFSQCNEFLGDRQINWGSITN